MIKTYCTGTKAQLGNTEDSWTVAEARTNCTRCGAETVVLVRHEVTYEPKRVLHPPKRMPRKLCTACKVLDFDYENDVPCKKSGKSIRTYDY